MTGDHKKRELLDRARIDLEQPHDVEYWTKRLAVSEAKLEEAIAKVGVMADAVRHYLGK